MTHADAQTPMACSLSAADATTRQAEWSSLLGRAVVTRSPVPGGIRLALAPFEGIRAELDRLVEAERECCPFLGLAVEDTSAGLVLTVTAPRDAEPIIRELLA